MWPIIPQRTPPAAGGGMTGVAGTEVSAMVDDDRVGRAEAATVSVGTERADRARDDPPCRTDDAREVPGSGGVGDVDAVSRLIRRVGERGG